MASAKRVQYNGTRSVLYPNGLIKVGGHRNWRNNNPGNIKSTNYPGSIGSDGTFAVFNSMEDGYKAQENLLQSSNYRNLSMHDAIYRWAPPSENDSAGYVKYVAEKTGIDPNKKMSDLTPEERSKMVHAMAAREGIQNGTGKVVEGATVNGDQATGGNITDDPFGSGGGTPTSGGGSSASNLYEDCNYPVSGGATGAICDKLAVVEGNGKYTQGQGSRYTKAAGKYQFISSTAESYIIKTGQASNKNEARSLWEKCRSSDSPDCRALQDRLCESYSSDLLSKLPADQRTLRNLYLMYNQGEGGARAILKAKANGTKVTNPQIVRNMDNQAWGKSYGDPNTFLSGMDGYIKGRGQDPNTII